MVAASSAVASTVTTANTLNLTSGAAVCGGSGPLHATLTAVPRAIGPNSSVATARHPVGGHPEDGGHQRADGPLLGRGGGHAGSAGQDRPRTPRRTVVEMDVRCAGHGGWADLCSRALSALHSAVPHRVGTRAWGGRIRA